MAIQELRITKIEVKDATGFHKLYDGATGAKTPWQMPPGTSWELRVTCYGKNSVAGWSMAVTQVSTGVPAAYEKTGKPTKVYTSSGTIAFDLNMGVIGANVTIQRVKAWGSDYLDLPSGQGLPPIAQY